MAHCYAQILAKAEILDVSGLNRHFTTAIKVCYY